MVSSLLFKSNQKFISGFGLVELLVSVSIMVLVTGTVIARHSSFNGASLLRSQAWEVALGIREVQLTAVSATNVGSATDFRQVYGVHFNVSNTGDRQSYVVFRDLSPIDYFYRNTDELVGRQGRLDRRFEISDIRSFSSLGAESSLTNLSITFERPNYDARFRINSFGDLNADRIEITVRVIGTTDNANRRIIEVTRAGQISVRNN